jgi:hypothetical protein
VAGSISASFLAGTIATTSGHRSGSLLAGNHWLVRQYPPCPATRYAHATAATVHAMLNASITAA